MSASNHKLYKGKMNFKTLTTNNLY